MELNWFGSQNLPGDNVGIYNVDPQLQPRAEPMCSVDPSLYPGGYYRSTVELPVTFFNLTTLRIDPCLGYWAAYKSRNGKLFNLTNLKYKY